MAAKTDLHFGQMAALETSSVCMLSHNASYTTRQREVALSCGPKGQDKTEKVLRLDNYNT